MSQSKDIKHYLSSGYSLTPLEALNKFGCMRLAAVVYDLKKEGMAIGSRTIKSLNGKRYSEYYSLDLVNKKPQTKLF